jgi:hypothetical protein
MQKQGKTKFPEPGSINPETDERILIPGRLSPDNSEFHPPIFLPPVRAGVISHRPGLAKSEDLNPVGSDSPSREENLDPDGPVF